MTSKEETPQFLASLIGSAPLDGRSVELAVLHFHRSVRPRLSKFFAGVGWADLADLASEVELRLILRLHSEVDRRRAAELWENRPLPQFGQVVMIALNLRLAPRLTAKRAMATALQRPIFYRALATVGPLEDEANIPIEQRAQELVTFYLDYAEIDPRRPQQIDHNRFIEACRSVGVLTLEHARLAMRLEVASSRSGLFSTKDISFASTSAWEAYCLSVARSSYLDLHRKRARDLAREAEIQNSSRSVGDEDPILDHHPNSRASHP
jgi:hypothetical protein